MVAGPSFVKPVNRGEEGEKGEKGREKEKGSL